MKIFRACFGFETILLCLVALMCLCTDGKPIPADSVTQTGEPSHFQVDDRAAEIEVNANPAGVKVNAKPASLQVVAKPGTPAVPIFHPAIHVAPHFQAPPMIYHQPAMFYHGGVHSPFSYFHHGHSRGWAYFGLKRNKLPSAHAQYDETNERKKERSHKSDIPHRSDTTDTSKEKWNLNKKRQFIQAAPLTQPSTFGTPSPFSFAPLPHYVPMAPSFEGFEQQGGPRSSLQEDPYIRGGISAAQGSQLQVPQLQSAPGYGTYGSIAGLYQALLGQAALYSSIGQGGGSLYNHQDQMPSAQQDQQSQYSRSSLLGYGQPFTALPLTQQFAVPSPRTSVGTPSGNGLYYVPSPLAQSYAAQPPLPIGGLLGNPLLGQGLYSPYAALTRQSIVGRSKVPRVSHHKSKHKRSADSQTKRQMIINPALISPPVQQYRHLAPAMQPFIGQQPSSFVAPQIPLQRTEPSLFAGAQSPQVAPAQSSEFGPVLPLTQSRSILPGGAQSAMFASAQSPLFPRARSPLLARSQAGQFTSQRGEFQDSLPSLQSLNSNLITPVEGITNPRFGPMARHMTSPYEPNMMTSYASSRMASPFGLQSTMSSFHPMRRQQNFPSLPLLPRRSYFRHGFHYGRFPHRRKFTRRPLYRRRLHPQEDYDDKAAKEISYDREKPYRGEVVTQAGDYTVTDNDSNNPGEVLVDRQNVGFGPITVEAKTAEGMRKTSEEDLKKNKIPSRP